MAKNETKVPEAPEQGATVTEESVPAQVSPAVPEYLKQYHPDTVDVSEVSVVLDRPILDPNSPDAVQVPDEGKGSLDLPIHALQQPSVEERFASGDAPEATGVVDGETVTASEAEAKQGDQPTK